MEYKVNRKNSYKTIINNGDLAIISIINFGHTQVAYKGVHRDKENNFYSYRFMFRYTSKSIFIWST